MFNLSCVLLFPSKYYKLEEFIETKKKKISFSILDDNLI